MEIQADRDALLKQVTILGFMATDLHLFLNTHPHDKEALEMYNDTIEKAEKARCQYEAVYGPLTYGKQSAAGWPWMDCPWPWEASFNYCHSKIESADGWSALYGEELL